MHTAAGPAARAQGGATGAGGHPYIQGAGRTGPGPRGPAFDRANYPRSSREIEYTINNLPVLIMHGIGLARTPWPEMPLEVNRKP